MNKIILPIILLLGMPIFSQAASVTDPKILDLGENGTFSKLQHTRANTENTYTENLGQNPKASTIPLPSGQNTANNSEAFRPQTRQNHQPNDNYFGVVYNHIISSDDAVWKDLTSTVKDVNESLNTIDHWAENFLNTTATSTDLSSINLRNTVLIQENANLKSVIENQGNDSAFLTELDKATADNLDLRTEYDLLNFLLSPSLLIKALAENFSIIVLAFTVLMGLRLLMKFVLEKTKKRQQRRKGRRKRSIDGFIN